MVGLSAKRLGIVLVVLTVALAGCSSGGGGTATADGTADGGDGGATAQAGEWNADQHEQAIQNAGSYTINIDSQGVVARGGNITDTPNVSLTVKHDVGTGEYLYSFGNTTSYQPPDSDTVYSQFNGQVRQQPASEATTFTYVNLTSGESGAGNVTDVLGQLDAQSGSTDLGPAFKYVITDETEVDVPGNVSSDFGEVTSYEQTIYIDKDTGVLAKYTTEKVVEDETGSEYTISNDFEITNLGSTEIEEPDWVSDS